MTELEHDVADDNDDGVANDEHFVPDKLPQIEAWKVEGAEDLPDEVKSTEIDPERDAEPPTA